MEIGYIVMGLILGITFLLCIVFLCGLCYIHPGYIEENRS